MNEFKISPRLEYLSGLAWRILVIAGVIALAIFLIIQLKIVVIPFVVGMLVTALLYPAVSWLTRKGMKRGIAVVLSIIVALAVVGGLLFAVAKQVQYAYPSLRDQFVVTLDGARDILSSEPFGLQTEELDAYINDIWGYAQANADVLITGISSAGSTAGHFVTGIFLALFATIFLLLDGKNIWLWTTKLFPRASRERISKAGIEGWHTLISFVKSQIAVAGVDAVGIGLAALLLQVPLAIPIAVVVFFGSFIPVVGAIITGTIAVVLALIFNGWLVAVLMLAAVLLVQLIEGHVLQPFLMGKAVKIHPLAIVFAVAIGSLLAGIPGALFAVPIVAVANTMIASLAKGK